MTKEHLIQELKDRRVFVITGKINAQMANDLRATLLVFYIMHPKEDIYLIFDTEGGDLQSALYMYDFIKAFPTNVIAIVIGKCHSAGLIILAACKKENRRSLKHSRFLFHAMLSGIDGFDFSSQRNPEETVKLFVSQAIKIHTHVKEVYMSEYGIESTKLEEMMNSGEDYSNTLFADDALSIGVIGQIVNELPFPV